MIEKSKRRLPIRFVMAAALFAAITPARAIDTGAGAPRERLLQQRTIIDLQAQENRQRRLEFQNRQQRLRDQDRGQIVRQPLELSKPRYRNDCRSGVSGNSYLSNCR